MSWDKNFSGHYQKYELEHALNNNRSVISVIKQEKILGKQLAIFVLTMVSFWLERKIRKLDLACKKQEESCADDKDSSSQQ